MKKLILLSAAILIASLTVTAQFAASTSMFIYPNSVNEDEGSGYDAITAENAFGVTLSYDTDPSKDVFDIYMSIQKGKMSMPLRGYSVSNNTSTSSDVHGSAAASFTVFKIGAGPQWYSQSFYIGLGGGLAFFENAGDKGKSLTGYFKAGVGYNLFLEVTYEYMRPGEKLFGVPEGGMRLNMDNMQLTIGYRF